MAERPDLWQLESDLHAQGYGTLCGVDEAGAGPTPPPVASAAGAARVVAARESARESTSADGGRWVI